MMSANKTEKNEGRLMIWYYGTTKENAESILAEGFRAGTYLGEGIGDVLEFGGEYIFEVAIPASWWSKDGCLQWSEAGWQMTITDPMPPTAIVAHYRLERTMLLENEKLRTIVFESNNDR